MINTICKILGIARRTYFHWQKSDDKSYAINLLNKYFNKNELEEFINSGKISRLEVQYYVLNNKVLKYLDDFDSIDNKHLSDFYFYFLTYFTQHEEMFFDIRRPHRPKQPAQNFFIKVLNSYMCKTQYENLYPIIFQKESEANENYFKNAISNNFRYKDPNNENKTIQNYIEKTLLDSEKIFENLYNDFSFIEKWDEETFYFIKYLIETDFDIFINSKNHKLLYHAIGFLVYSNMELPEHDISLERSIIIDNIYDFFINNQKDINKDLIKEISFDFNKLLQYKKVKKIIEYYKDTNQKYSEEAVNKIASDPIKYDKLSSKIDKYYKGLNQEMN